MGAKTHWPRGILSQIKELLISECHGHRLAAHFYCKIVHLNDLQKVFVIEKQLRRRRAIYFEDLRDR